MRERNRYFDGKQRYKVVEHFHEAGENIIAQGFTSQKQVTEFYKAYRAEHGKDSTKKFTTVGYKEGEERH